MIAIISSPDEIEDEATKINALFDEGMQIFHIRKPAYSKMQLQKLLKNIASKHLDKISLHQHHDLAEQFGIHRLHFTSAFRNEVKKMTFKQHVTLSTSVHSDADFEGLEGYFDYCFYGPVFNSISKKGYLKMHEPDLPSLKKIYSNKIIGIGGINENNIRLVKKKGFDGAALLGFIWQEVDKVNMKFNSIKNKWE